MQTDIADCIWHCLVCQQDKPPALPKEELHWTDKGSPLFFGWSISTVGTFPWDEDGNCYLLVAMDLFSKWVEICTVPLLHSCRVAEFLHDSLVAR